MDDKIKYKIFQKFLKFKYIESILKQFPIDRADMGEEAMYDELIDFELELYEALQTEFSKLSKDFQKLESDAFFELYNEENIEAVPLVGGFVLGVAALDIFHNKANAYLGTDFFINIKDKLNGNMLGMYNEASSRTINEIVAKLPRGYKTDGKNYLKNLPIDDVLASVDAQYSNFLTANYLENISGRISTRANKILNEFESNIDRVFALKQDFLNIDIYSAPYLYAASSTIQNLIRNRAIVNVYQRAKVTTVTFNAVGDDRTCFPEFVSVLTSNGRKKIKDIKINDEVLTHKGNYKKVLARQCFNYNDDIYEIKPENKKFRNLKCTKNHPILIKRNNEYYWIEARNLKIGDIIIKYNYLIKKSKCKFCGKEFYAKYYSTHKNYSLYCSLDCYFKRKTKNMIETKCW